jgi:hypothetical protein
MQRPPGFKSDLQRARFFEAQALYRRGGPLAPACGARTKTGVTCTQVPLDGEARCLRHGGPGAARRHRQRQLAGLQTGRVSPDEWARAEARRARNAVTYAWKRDPRLPGRTIDLGPGEDAFRADAQAQGVDADALFPALADWLRWSWRRYIKDRPDDARWEKVVRQELPRCQAAADEAVVRRDLWPGDWRTRDGRAIKAALRAGGLARAQAVAEGFRQGAEAAQGVVHDQRAAPAKRPLTDARVKPWTARTDGGVWKRRLPDRVRAPKPQKPPGRPGRPRKRPVTPHEIEALAGALWQAGAQVHAMYANLPDDAARLGFLRDLNAVVAAPDDARAQRRWAAWVSRAS